MTLKEYHMKKANPAALESIDSGDKSQPIREDVITGGRRPVWVAEYADGWEILIYHEQQRWEACFFKWNFCHEHADGHSFDDARIKAQKRIDEIGGRRPRVF
jgi:hypothetical protein